LINKQRLLDGIIIALEALYQDAFDAAMRAYDTAKMKKVKLKTNTIP